MGCVASSSSRNYMTEAQDIDVQSNQGLCRIWSFPDQTTYSTGNTHGDASRKSAALHLASAHRGSNCATIVDAHQFRRSTFKCRRSTRRSVSFQDKHTEVTNGTPLDTGVKNVVQAMMPDRSECCLPVFERATYVTRVDDVPVYSGLKKGLGGKGRKEICKLSADTLLYLKPEISRKAGSEDDGSPRSVKNMPFGMLHVKVKSGPSTNIVGWVAVNASGYCVVRCMNTPSVMDRKSSPSRSIPSTAPDSPSCEDSSMDRGGKLAVDEDHSVGRDTFDPDRAASEEQRETGDNREDTARGRDTIQSDQDTLLLDDNVHAPSECASSASANGGPARVMLCGFMW
eukprot:GEMP01042796.1.p1 GENE.GEMP01042796.1~~GEMP01042796.1.p1  ORF type:complete len:342 (+),score=78.52 GEMP01042796.1:197-1222(+)